MIKKNLNLFFLILFIFSVHTAVQAQEEPGADNPSDAITDQKTADPVQKEKAPVGKAKKNKTEKARPKEVKKETVRIEEDRINDDLLTIKDGDFLYSRIPEIKVKASEQNADSGIVRLSESGDKDKQDSEKDKKNESGEGLLGLSGSATDIIVKVFFVVLIIVVFLLYRARSRVSSGGVGVLRSIPKK